MAKPIKKFSLKDDTLLEGITPPQPKKARVVSLFQQTTEVELPDLGTTAIRSDPSTVVPRSDRGPGETVMPWHHGKTVAPLPEIDGHTVVPGIDGRTKALRETLYSSQEDKTTIPLSELQWSVWQSLCKLAEHGGRTSYQELADALGQKKRGVQRAVDALKREGAVTIRLIKTKEFQGFSVTIDQSVRFRQATQAEVFGIVKRGGTVVPRGHGLTVVPGSSGPRMYVCKNTYIQEKDIKALLQTARPDWQIREQTLVQVADLFPTMTALEFRLSLQRLVEQAESGKQEIKNPNAWLKAAFEKNGGPLVTEREIEARLGQGEKNAPKPPLAAITPEDRETAVLRRYVAASLEERAQIDAIAQKRAAPLLTTVSADKHAGILDQAKIESTQEFFGL